MPNLLITINDQFPHPSPCEESQLKCVLKEHKMDEVENEARAIEPEEVITKLNNRHPLHNLSPFLNSKPHLGYDHL